MCWGCGGRCTTITHPLFSLFSSRSTALTLWLVVTASVRNATIRESGPQEFLSQLIYGGLVSLQLPRGRVCPTALTYLILLGFTLIYCTNNLLESSYPPLISKDLECILQTAPPSLFQLEIDSHGLFVSHGARGVAMRRNMLSQHNLKLRAPVLRLWATLRLLRSRRLLYIPASHLSS